MADAYVDKVANELADLALADQAATGDIAIVDQIGELLGASSQILQETYLTAVRVRRAEARARALLAARAARGSSSTASAAPVEDISAADPVMQPPVADPAPAADPASGNAPRRVTR
ncbi:MULTISPECIES: hypothetical protein [unclassified Yoonia]|uniref:hypothetical protein n=1 Tax=unclassified Yoonia TaxID=2629118 RepID=UPI002AFF989B|nr:MULTISPECIES: hypothetical protein [unclassified Yoonia]